jgi:hypothetical protein
MDFHLICNQEQTKFCSHQLEFSRKRLAAVAADEGAVAAVKTRVGDQLLLLRKALVADGTRERSLAAVQLEVHVESALLAEGLAAALAVERRVLQVGALVGDQVVLQGE